MTSFTTIILAAGKGTRMQSELPKVMHPLAGQPLITHVLDAVSPLKPDQLACVIGPGMEGLEAAIGAHRPGSPCIIQQKQQGTADAVKVAQEAVDSTPGPVIILYGDSPLITTELVQQAIAAVDQHAVAVIGMRPDDPGKYGRLKLSASGDEVEAIVEYKDASEEERAIGWCNSGIIAANGKHLWALLHQVDNNNASGEFYLTDIVGLARGLGLTCALVEAEVETVLGINTRAELAQAEALMQQRLRAKAMDGGATLVAPETVFLSRDTKIGRDVVIHPNVVIGKGVAIEDNAEIKAFSHLEQCHVHQGATVGPYARLRPGADIAKNAHIGNFVEIKNSQIAEGAKVNHLSYVGDAEVGKGANVGAGTITCNYDGFIKSKTVIGDGAFIGSNSALVAPVTIGKNAMVGAGSTITENVPDGATALARGKQVNLEGHSDAFRQKQAEKKKAG